MNNLDDLHKRIAQLFEHETKRIIEEEAEAAGKRVVERVRGLAGQVATRVAHHVDFTRMHDRLVITVKIPEKET